MTKPQNSPADFDELLRIKERQLILQRENVWGFIGTPHSSRDTKDYQAQVRQSEIELGTILDALLDGNDIPAQSNDEVKQLRQRCRDLGAYTRDMGKALSEDLAECNRAEDKKSIDVIKNVTFFFAVPAAFIAAVKNGLGENTIGVSEAAAAGVGVSVTVLSRKRIVRTFSTAGRAIMETPQKIGDSFMLYYVRDTIRQSGTQVAKMIAGARRQNRKQPAANSNEL